MTVISRLRDAGYEVYTREQWGANVSAYADRAASSYYRVAEPADYHFLHISVTSDTDTVKEGFAGAKQIEGYGYSTPKQVSYQMLVTNEGKAFEGQNYGVKGTHTVNDKGIADFPKDLNREGYAVALMQNVQDEVTDVQVHLIAAAFAAAELEGHVKRGAKIYPHRHFAWKSCPGDKAVARLDEIQRLKDEMVRTGNLNPNQEDVMNKQQEAKLDEAVRLARVIERMTRAKLINANQRLSNANATLREIKDGLDKLEAGAANKAQIHRLRKDIAALADQLVEEPLDDTDAEEAS